MTARNRATGDRRPDVIRTRRQALAALRRIKAERKQRTKPPSPTASLPAPPELPQAGVPTMDLLE